MAIEAYRSISPKRSDAPGARSPDNRRAEEMKRTITASERRPDPLKSGRSAGEIGFPKLVVRSSGYACRLRSSASLGSPATSARSEEHTSELPSLMRISYAVFCLNKKNKKQ